MEGEKFLFEHVVTTLADPGGLTAEAAVQLLSFGKEVHTHTHTHKHKLTN